MVFISYAREDRGFARSLASSLEGQGLLTVADWKIPTGSDYKEWIARSIDESTAFLFIMSEWSIDSEPCLGELRRAVHQQLRLLPVVRRRVPDERVPSELRLPNWLFFEDEDNKEAQLLALVRDARTDLDADLEEREWRQRDGQWERAGRPKWFMVAPSLDRLAKSYQAA